MFSINFQNECFCNTSLSHGKRKVLEHRAFAKCFLYLWAHFCLHLLSHRNSWLAFYLAFVSIRSYHCCHENAPKTCLPGAWEHASGRCFVYTPWLPYLTLLCKQSAVIMDGICMWYCILEEKPAGNKQRYKESILLTWCPWLIILQVVLAEQRAYWICQFPRAFIWELEYKTDTRKGVRFLLLLFFVVYFLGLTWSYLPCVPG